MKIHGYFLDTAQRSKKGIIRGLVLWPILSVVSFLLLTIAAGGGGGGGAAIRAVVIGFLLACVLSGAESETPLTSALWGAGVGMVVFTVVLLMLLPVSHKLSKLSVLAAWVTAIFVCGGASALLYTTLPLNHSKKWLRRLRPSGWAFVVVSGLAILVGGGCGVRWLSSMH